MLHLQIGDAWEPQDFIDVFRAVDSMYYKLIMSQYRRARRMGLYFDEKAYIHSEWAPDVDFENFLDHQNQRLLSLSKLESREHERLFVRRIIYASPGGIDLLGIGKVVEVIANSIREIAAHFDEKGIRRERDEQAVLETELKRLEIEKEKENLRSVKIRNAQSALELLERFPGEQSLLVPLLVRDQDVLSTLIADGKLIGASAVPDDKASRD